MNGGQTGEGRAYVFHGSASGLATTAAWTAESNQASAFFGSSVAGTGDVNGDGFGDVIVGAPNFDDGQIAEGRAFVYLGSSSGLATMADWTAESDQFRAEFGAAVASAGDVNADGYSDVIVGAFYFDHGESAEGRAFIYLGAASGLATSAAWTAEGRAFVYLGNQGYGGWTQASQQRLSTDAAPIALLGESSSQRYFRIRVGFESTLAGFQWASPQPPKARLEWEVVGLGDRFEGSSIQWGRFEPLARAPLTFNELAHFPISPPGSSAPGSDPKRLCKWRVRVRTNNPLFPVTPWVSMPGNNVTESKLRPLEGVRSK